MQTSLHALTAELKRLKASGVKSLLVSEESLAKLRAAVAGRSAARGPAPVVETPVEKAAPAYKAP